MKERLGGQIQWRVAAAMTGPALLTTLTARGDKPEKQAKGQKKAEGVNIVLDWYPDAVYVFLYEVIEKGYFTEERLNVHIQFPSNENDAISPISAGKAELELYYQQDVVQMVANQGVKMRLFGTVCQSPLDIVFSLKDRNILSPKDLEGKTVGYAGTPLSEAMISVLMRKVSVDANALTLKDVGFNLMSSMTTGQVDTTTGCPVSHEVSQLEGEGLSFNYFSPTEYGVPDYYEFRLVTNGSVLRDKPGLTGKFVRTAKKGFTDFKTDPDAAVKLLLERQDVGSLPLSGNVKKKSTTVLLPKMESDSTPLLSQTESYRQENIDWMKQEGLIRRAPELKELFPAGSGNWENGIAEGEQGGRVARK